MFTYSEWREQFIRLVDDIEFLGLWVRNMHLPCPEEVWNELLNPYLRPVAVGLLARIKETVKNARNNVDYLLLRARSQPDVAILEDLYYLFVVFEYGEFRRALTTYSLPVKRKIFDSLISAIRKMEGGG